MHDHQLLLRLGFLIVDMGKGYLKVSLCVNVVKIAEGFGGGGYIRVAGFRVKNTAVDNLKEKLLEKLEKS